jgi:hypothetical protein
VRETAKTPTRERERSDIVFFCVPFSIPASCASRARRASFHFLGSRAVNVCVFLLYQSICLSFLSFPFTTHHPPLSQKSPPTTHPPTHTPIPFFPQNTRPPTSFFSPISRLGSPPWILPVAPPHSLDPREYP